MSITEQRLNDDIKTLSKKTLRNAENLSNAFDDWYDLEKKLWDFETDKVRRTKIGCRLLRLSHLRRLIDTVVYLTINARYSYEEEKIID